MTSFSYKLNYTARDFDTNLSALQEVVKVNYPDKWNSFFEGDLGSALLEVIAYDFSILSYVLDMQAQECFLDTLQLRESLLHFSRLTGYQIQRATAASVEVYAEAATVPSDINGYQITDGTTVRSKDGSVWEVSGNYSINQNKFTPVRVTAKYGDITGHIIRNDGSGDTVTAQVKIAAGTSYAVLSDMAGVRLPSYVNFGNLVGQGSILKLLNVSNGSGGFGTVPDTNHDEYAIIGVGKLSSDLYDNTILYLDRQWDLSSDFVGQWSVENRNILLVQGETKEENFVTPTDVDARKNFSIKPAFYPVVGSSSNTTIPSGVFGSTLNGGVSSGVIVSVDGIRWTETTSLLFETGDALAYEVDFDELDRMTVKFGDGVFGSLVDSGKTIDVQYRIGGGAVGNVQQSSFDTTIVAWNLSDSRSPVTVYVTNPYTVGSGGQDRETITQAKKNIPQFVRANDRAVSVEDYAYLASNFVDASAGRIKLAKGVLHSNMVPREQNIVWVYTWVQGTNGQLVAPTLTLKNRLLDYLNDRKMITDEVVIMDGVNTIVPMHLRYRFNSNADSSVVLGNVQVAVNGVFAALTPGDPLFLSYLYDVLQSVPDIQFVNILSPTDNFIPNNQFELYSNSVQVGVNTHLLVAANKGDLSFSVALPNLFQPSQRVSIFENGKNPSAGIIAQVSGSVVTLQPDYPLSDAYTLEADVVPSDFLVYGWAYENPVNVFVRYTAGTGVDTDTLNSIINRKIREYFNKTLRPEENLSRTKLQLLVSGVPNVITATVTFNASDSTVEQIVPSANEIVSLGNLSINNRVIS